MGKNRATPRGLAIAQCPGHDRWRKPLDRTPTGVHQAGLLRQGLATLGHADQIPGAFADATGVHDGHIAVVAVDLEDVFT